MLFLVETADKHPSGNGKFIRNLLCAAVALPVTTAVGVS